jgi:hypothetical protein
MNKKTIFKRGMIIISALALLLIIPFTVFAEPTETTVEGVGNYFVTGESYPSAIALSGYNSRDLHLYSNVTLTTTKTVDVGETATFSYYVEVYDTSGNLIGGLGNATTPQTEVATTGESTADVDNMDITLSGALTAEFKVVIIVTNVAIV